MRPIPVELQSGPFTLKQAKRLKLTPRMVEGRRFVRLFPRVYRVADYEMKASDWVAAARLALPKDAVPTGITRIQMAGLDYGPLKPLRFVVARDHHISFDGVFLHRTKKMPPTDDEGVVLAAAFIAYCARARVIDAIKVGDWLLRNTPMTKAAVRDLALAQLWRDGADEAIWILDHLDEESRSLPESETRAVLEFAGLPRPEVNKLLHLEEGLVVMPDLLYRTLGVLVEYEGGQHQEEREQYTSDLDRYAAMRRNELRYVQVTKEKLRLPKRLVGEVYRELVAAGYDGPPPSFGEHWRLLFLSVTTAVGERRRPGGDRAVG
jgi:hypothetical protein